MRTCSWILIFLATISFGTAVYAADYDQARRAAEELSRVGNKAGAADLLEAAVGTNIDADAQWLRGYIGILRNAPARDVMNQFLLVANTFPESNRAADALLRAGYLRDKLGDDARQDWERVVRDHPNTGEAAEALHCLGHLALRAGDRLLAAAKFDESAALSEASADVVQDSVMEAGYAYVSHYWQTHDFDVLPKAIARFKRLKDEGTDTEKSLKARMGLGEVYLLEGFFDRGALEYQEVLNADPQNAFIRATAQFELACCLYGKKDYTAAVDAFDTLLSGRPGVTLKQKDAAWRAARPGYAELVARDTEKASKLCGLDLIPEALCWKARALVGLKQYAEAGRLAEQVLSEFPNAACAERAEQTQRLCRAREGR